VSGEKVERDSAERGADVLPTVGYRVVAVADGLAAIEPMARECPALVITDTMMPRRADEHAAAPREERGHFPAVALRTLPRHALRPGGPVLAGADPGGRIRARRAARQGIARRLAPLGRVALASGCSGPGYHVPGIARDDRRARFLSLSYNPA